MTTDKPADQLDKDVSPKGTQQQRPKKPFQIVLVDIEKAANDDVIHCVKIPLEEPDLKFVALSYRWGELHETLIDTKVGYTASITSFALADFFQLCYMMTLESDLKHIKYVWVDAICVDQRPSKRKATIYQMSNIYDRATFILAVPDLHLTYLKGISIKHRDIIEDSNEFRMDLYHLIHGNAAKLAAMEEDFLNYVEVPKQPPALRPLLLKYTSHFAHSFMHYQKHDGFYCPLLALDHLCATSSSSSNTPSFSSLGQKWFKGNKHVIGDLHRHQCHATICPLALFCHAIPTTATVDDLRQFVNSNWKSRIMDRSTSIRQSMEFLTDLIKDWSSRVWVISEYSIAKTENTQLKYWFTQLAMDSYHSRHYQRMDTFVFFTFDFHASDAMMMMMKTPYYATQEEATDTRSESTHPVYIQFHYTMRRQLNQQTFLEMILRSKASRNEDRFYSVLPLSQYQNKKTEVSHWKTDSMVSVKLKLYEIMTTKDKLALLFWSTHGDAIANGVLPTFATSTLPVEFQSDHLMHLMNSVALNFDLDDPSTVTLHCHEQANNTIDEDDDENDSSDGDDLDRYYYSLRLKPKEYYVIKHDSVFDKRTDVLARYVPVCKQQLGIGHASTRTLDIVAVPAFQEKNGMHGAYDHRLYCFTMVGCFVTNKWILLSEHSYVHPLYEIDGRCMRYHVDDDHSDHKPVAFFDVY